MQKANIVEFYKRGLKDLDKKINSISRRDPKLHILHAQRRDLVKRIQHYESLHSKDIPGLPSKYGDW